MKYFFMSTVTTSFFVLFIPISTVFSTEKTRQKPLEFVTLFGGTPVSFTLNQNLHSDDLVLGSSLMFIVDDAVVTENQIVIRKGERAEGVITRLWREEKKLNYQELEITVKRVKAIDGTYVNLYGKPLLKRSKCRKCPIELGLTTRLEGNVEQNTNITTR